MMLGISLVDTFKILIPRRHDDSDIVVGEQYKITLTKDSAEYNLRVENLFLYKTHWEVEAIEDNV